MNRSHPSTIGFLKQLPPPLPLLIRLLFALLLLSAMELARAASTYVLPSAVGFSPFGSCSFTEGTTYTCTGSITLDNHTTINFDSPMTLKINGNFTVGNNSNINGSGTSNAVTIVTTGSIDIGNSLSSSVNFNAGTDFVAGNSAIIVGNITAGDDITVGTNVSITGSVSATDDLSVGSGTISGSCTYDSTNYVCSGGSSAASFTVTPSRSSASTCASAGGSPNAPWITITAKNASGTTVTNYTGTITINNIGSGALSIKTGNGTLSGNTYTLVSSDNGVAVLYITDPTAESVTPSVTDGTASGSSSSSITFSDNVLVISDADSLAPTYQPVAGRPHKLSAAVWSKDSTTGICSINTKINSTGTAAKMWITTTSSHPSSATSPAASTSSSCSGSVALPATAPGSNNISLAFSSGTAAFYLCTSDVGQYSVNIIADSLPGSAKDQSTSDILTVVPFTIVVSDIQRGTTTNPGTATASGTVFANAGSEFQATVSAYKWNSAADTNNDGYPDSGVTLANATGSGTVSGYAQTVTLKAAVLIPSDGNIGSGLANGVVPVTNGSTTITTLSYPEVGSFTLSAAPAENYLGSANLSGRVLIYAKINTSSSDTSVNYVVGRFTPDHFVTTLTPSCTGNSGTNFTYSRQPFAMTIKAVNAAGTTTQNYSGTVNLEANPSTAGTLGTTSTALSAGTTTINDQKLTMAAWTEATAVTIRAIDSVDTGITSFGYETGTNFRIGRVRLLNASGSELLELPMTMRVEYWDTKKTGWMLNTSDSCTGGSTSNSVTLNKDNVTMTNAPALCAYDTGFPGNSNIGCSTAGPSGKRFLKGGVSGFAGNFNLIFAPPGSGNTGTVQVTATVPDWLQYPWTGTSYSNPRAKATFGKVGNSRVIFRRELY